MSSSFKAMSWIYTKMSLKELVKQYINRGYKKDVSFRLALVDKGIVRFSSNSNMAKWVNTGRGKNG